MRAWLPAVIVLGASFAVFVLGWSPFGGASGHGDDDHMQHHSMDHSQHHGAMMHDGSSSGGGMMAMSFYIGTDVTVLFSSWRVSGLLPYIATWCIVFLLAILRHVLLLWRAELVRAVVLKQDRAAPATAPATSPRHQSSASAAATSAVLLRLSAGMQYLASARIGTSTFAELPLKVRWQSIGALFLAYTLSFALMLVTMTYEVGLFFAVVAGETLGAVLVAKPAPRRIASVPGPAAAAAAAAAATGGVDTTSGEGGCC